MPNKKSSNDKKNSTSGLTFAHHANAHSFAIATSLTKFASAASNTVDSINHFTTQVSSINKAPALGMKRLSDRFTIELASLGKAADPLTRSFLPTSFPIEKSKHAIKAFNISESAFPYKESLRGYADDFTKNAFISKSNIGKLKITGAGLGVFSAALTVKEIASSDNKPLETLHQTAILGSGRGGMVLAAQLATPPCTWLGGATGPAAPFVTPGCIIAAGIAGGIAGPEVMERLIWKPAIEKIKSTPAPMDSAQQCTIPLTIKEDQNLTIRPKATTIVAPLSSTGPLMLINDKQANQPVLHKTLTNSPASSALFIQRAKAVSSDFVGIRNNFSQPTLFSHHSIKPVEINLRKSYEALNLNSKISASKKPSATIPQFSLKKL